MPRRTARRAMSAKEQVRAIVKVAKLSVRIAPLAVVLKLGGTVINAVLPFVTVYYAALTTTALAAAFMGNENAANQVILYVCITGGLGLLSSIWSTFDNYIQTKMRYVIDTRVSNRMYEHFLSLEFWRYEDKETTDLYERARNFAQFFSWIFDRLSTVLSEAIIVVAGLLALLYVNAWLALIVLVAVGPTVYIQFKLSRLQIDQWNKNVDTRRQINMIEWNLFQPEHIIELRLYGLIKHLLGLRQKWRDKDEKGRIEFERQYLGRRIMADALQSAVEIGALIWVTFEIVAHRQPIGQFVYVQQVLSRVMGGVSGFISTLSSIDEDVANLFDYQRFMELSEFIGGEVSMLDAPQEISIQNVSFAYPHQKREVLNDISLTIRKGEHVAIVGENGAGKSTLIKLISGLYKPKKGEILVDGEQLSNITIENWHRNIAVLTQNFLDFGFATARDNVLFGDVNKQNEDLYKESLVAAEAADFVKKLPYGDRTLMDSWIESDGGEKGVRVSGGQWQRIALARNFYRDAPIVILDEPTSAIDALAEARIFERLFKRKDKTIITISHRFTTVKKASMIYMMKDGCIVEQGTCDELIAKRGEFFTMFESQL